MGSLRAKQASYIEVMKAISVGGLQGLTRHDRAMFDYIVESMHRYTAGSVDPNFEGYDADLKLYLPFDETSGQTAFDLSGNGNTGTATGTTIVDGVFGKARSFNGVDDCITFADMAGTSISDPSVSGVLTLELWVYAIGGDYILSSGAQTSSRGIALSYQSGTPFYYLNDGTTQWRTAPTLSASTWTHLAFPWNGTNLYYYKNGVYVSTATSAALSVADDYTTLTIGKPNSTDEYYFEGKLDEVRIYSRVLTADEIYLHYLAGALKLGLI